MPVEDLHQSVNNGTFRLPNGTTVYDFKSNLTSVDTNAIDKLTTRELDGPPTSPRTAPADLDKVNTVERREDNAWASICLDSDGSVNKTPWDTCVCDSAYFCKSSGKVSSQFLCALASAWLTSEQLFRTGHPSQVCDGHCDCEGGPDSVNCYWVDGKYLLRPIFNLLLDWKHVLLRRILQRTKRGISGGRQQCHSTTYST